MIFAGDDCQAGVAKKRRFPGAFTGGSMIHYHGNVPIEWTAGEWERFQAIKQAHYDDPLWKPPRRDARRKNNISACVSSVLWDAVTRQAKMKGVSVSCLLNNILSVIYNAESADNERGIK